MIIKERTRLPFTCRNPHHYESLIINGACPRCGRVWGLEGEDAQALELIEQRREESLLEAIDDGFNWREESAIDRIF